MVSEGERISTARSGEPLKNPLGGRLNPCNRFLIINDTSGERRLPDFIRYPALEPNTAPSLRSETNLSNAAESFITIFSCSIPAGTITSSPFTNSCLYPFSGKDSSSFSVHVFFATVVSIKLLEEISLMCVILADNYISFFSVPYDRIPPHHDEFLPDNQPQSIPP